MEYFLSGGLNAWSVLLLPDKVHYCGGVCLNYDDQYMYMLFFFFTAPDKRVHEVNIFSYFSTKTCSWYSLEVPQQSASQEYHIRFCREL